MHKMSGFQEEHPNKKRRTSWNSSTQILHNSETEHQPADGSTIVGYPTHMVHGLPGMSLSNFGRNGHCSFEQSHTGMGTMSMGINLGLGMKAANSRSSVIEEGMFPGANDPRAMGYSCMTGQASSQCCSLPNCKVYPQHQAQMYSSPGSPSPPIYPCGVCHIEVNDNDQAILCESGCKNWFHRICTGLSEAAFYLLTQEIYAEWVCNNCFSKKQD